MVNGGKLMSEHKKNEIWIRCDLETDGIHYWIENAYDTFEKAKGDLEESGELGGYKVYEDVDMSNDDDYFIIIKLEVK